MISHLVFGILMSAFGLWMAIHCPRAAIREYRASIAHGLDTDAKHERYYDRETEPLGFWFTILGTALAGVFGLIFFVVGVSVLLRSLL